MPSVGDRTDDDRTIVRLERFADRLADRSQNNIPATTRNAICEMHGFVPKLQAEIRRCASRDGARPTAGSRDDAARAFDGRARRFQRTRVRSTCPDVVSLSLDDATRALAERKLTLVGQRTRSERSDRGEQSWTSQSPQAGSPVDPGSTIDVVISTGLGKAHDPGCRRQTREATRRPRLTATGLTVQIEYVVDPSATQGTVLKQSPDASGVSPQRRYGHATGCRARRRARRFRVRACGSDGDRTRRRLQSRQHGVRSGRAPKVSVARTEPTAGSSLRPGEDGDALC